MYTPQKCDYKYQLVNKKKKKFADIKKSCTFALLLTQNAVVAQW